IDLISFFILRTLDDHSGVPNTQMSLIPFPTRELFEQQLPSFDLILLQNFEFAPYGIGQYLENIRSYVEGGGGLVMLGGALSFSAGGYAGTPVAEALPVELPAGLRGPLGTLDTASFRPRLTREGVGHPVTSLRFEVADNRAAWRGLPALEGINLVAGVRPKATVLAVHPRLKTAAGKAMPVIVSGEYGDGRTLAVTTDSLWRWGFVAAAAAGDNGRHYDKLWENAIRWLIRDPELRYLHVHSDSVEYPPGAPVRLDVRVLDRDYTPLAGAQVALEVVRGADPQRTEPTLRHTLTVGDSGEGSHQLSGLEPGVYRVRATATVAERTVTATDIFLVRAASDELDQPSADESLLQAIAAATGGQYLGTAEQLPAELPLRQPQVVRVDRRTDVELWSRPALLFLAFVFLGLEWVLRQRSGYL
ncbi:MAG: glutamine amidotransferase, partial [Myxococcota bacterium]